MARRSSNAPIDAVAADVTEAEGAHARRVDHPGQSVESGSRRAIAEVEVCRPRPVSCVDLADRPLGSRDQRVHQGGLADPGVADEDAAMLVAAGPAARSRSDAGRGHLHRDSERLRSAATSSSGAARSALVRHSKGPMPAS